MKTLPFPRSVTLGLLVVGVGAAVAQDTFQFAGFSFDQRNTPDRAALLGEGVVLGGAAFSAGLPTTTTGIILGFPETSAGFDGTRSLAVLTQFSSSGPRAVNLPAGNNGTSTRQGIEIWWSGQRGLPNGPGPDVVIFESASSIASVEGIMIRAHAIAAGLGGGALWTPWYYFAPAGFHITLGTEGAFADAFDFTKLGLPANAIVDRIQMSNLTAADRIEGPGILLGSGIRVGQGRVVFDGSSDVLPDAGAFDSDRLFDSSTYDPDPLYAAALHDVIPIAPAFSSIAHAPGRVSLSIDAGPGTWLLESTDSLAPASWELVESFTVKVEGLSLLDDIGQNGRQAPGVTGARWYRIRAP
jgi:hypothetical protein